MVRGKVKEEEAEVVEEEEAKVVEVVEEEEAEVVEEEDARMEGCDDEVTAGKKVPPVLLVDGVRSSE